MDKKAGLDPEFRRKLEAFERRLLESGIRVKLTCGYRSTAEQNRLYSLGRTKPGRIVTKARGGCSWHNFGLAADYAFVSGGQLTWDGPWKVFGRIARECGLEWGGDWKKFPDRPHVQWRRGKTLAEMRRSAE
ncbi:MAG TPA: M15 family metallopeptidase [Armatimonadota bacterium]|nr:M15 family metallopeptidase [Armatimonadota bacterium]